MLDFIARSLDGFATHRPWTAILLVVFVIGGVSSQGQPVISNDSDIFGPADPAIEAATRIGELFAADASVVPIQVVATAAGGDVLTLDGYGSAVAAENLLRSTSTDDLAFADILVPQPGTGPIVSFATPVQQAVAQGAPAPQNDSDVDAYLTRSLAQLPPEAAGFVQGLYPPSADLSAGTSSAGLLIAFVSAPRNAEERAALVALEGAFLDELDAVAVGDVTLTAFSEELIQYVGDRAGLQIPLLLLAAIGIIAVLLLFVYLPPRGMRLHRRIRRSAADTLLTLLVTILAIQFQNGMAAILGPTGFDVIGPVGGPAQIVPILLVGLGVDFVIHLNAAYRDGLGSDAVEAAMGRAIRIVGGALVLTSATTILGFLTNLASGIPVLTTFGVLATLGIAAAFVLSTTLFPAARVLLDRRPHREGALDADEIHSRHSGVIDRFVYATRHIAHRAPWVAVLSAVALTVGGLAVASRLEAGFSFLDFVPDDSAVRTAADTLFDDFGGGLGETTQVLVDGDLTDVDVWNGVAAGISDAARLDAVLTTGGRARATAPHVLVAELAMPDGPRFAPEVAAAAQAAGFGPDLTVALGADLGALVRAVRAAAPDAASGVLHGSGDAVDAALVTFSTQGGEDGALQLADDLEAAFVQAEAAGADVIATSTLIANGTVIMILQGIQTQSLVLALLAATLLLSLSFFVSDRRPVMGVITVVPVGIVVVLLFALMVFAGIQFGPVTATLAALAIGVGVDYTIHVTHRFLDFRREGHDILDAVDETLATTGSALATAALTTGFGFSVLMTSTLAPFRQFGLLTLAAVVSAALASVLLLPSLLVLWERARTRGAQDAPALATAE